MDNSDLLPVADAARAARWRRLQELFDTLLALPAAAREPWLAGLGDDEAIKREAARLVRIDQDEAVGGLPRASLRRAARIPPPLEADSDRAIETELDRAETLLERGAVDEARRLHERLAPLLAERFVAGSALRLRHAAMAARLSGSGAG
jgi:hypothetical protein